MDSLQMDHHGEWSNLEGVALRAYADHFGARASDPRFVVTGAADADATFAIAALAGYLPHPEADMTGKPAHLAKPLVRDLSGLARLINQVDTAPIGIDLSSSEEGKLILLWNQMGGGPEDALSFYEGVGRWRTLLAGRPRHSLLKAVGDGEAERVLTARDATQHLVLDHVAVVESPVWGFDQWYTIRPLIVAMAPNGNITVGCQNLETAELLLGPGGLKNVFPRMPQEGWGGREAIGGSPRGASMTLEDALAAARVIEAAIV